MLPARLETKLVFGLRAGGMQLDRYDVLSALSYRTEVWLSRRADLAIANARAVRADAVTRGLPPDRIAVIPNGIDIEAMRPDPAAGHAQRRTWGISADAFVIGCVARLDPMKDHANLLTAAASFARQHGDARFVLVGAGAPEYRDELRTLAQSLGVEERVVWAGELGDVRAAYSAFDIATLSSAFGEGFPNVVGEAMACGVPVVATDIGDVRSIVAEFGEVVPPRQPDLLCTAWAPADARRARGQGAGARWRHRVCRRAGGHPGRPALGRREGAAADGLATFAGPHLVISRRADQSSRHRQPGGADRGDQRLSGRGDAGIARSPLGGGLCGSAMAGRRR